MTQTFARARRFVPWWRKINLWWAIFGNEDDGYAPPGFEVARPQWQRAVLWWLRNPAHNLTFYVLGVVDRDRWIEGEHGTDVHAPGGGWLTCVTRVGRLALPFVSYQSAHIKAYAGWRPAGAFGIKFNIMRRQEK
ncbi:MAG: hypothetical protein QM639_09765 [Rhodocyclaceae bacterium]